jgi:hypothetical protein
VITVGQVEVHVVIEAKQVKSDVRNKQEFRENQRGEKMRSAKDTKIENEV